MMDQEFNVKQFVIITLITSVWINLSEVARYFLFVMPRVKFFFSDEETVAQMNLGIFMIWGVWDTILTAALVFIFWLYAKVYGNNNQSVIVSSIVVWTMIFVIFWMATANMGLANWNILWITLPLSLIEMIVGAWIASKLYERNVYGT